MKKKLIFIVFLLSVLRGGVTAQNIYESIGKQAELLTLSNGQFQEFFPNDTLVRIGTVLLNTQTHEIVDFITLEDTASISAVEADVASRFLSVDPIGREYPELTPYQFASNTPIESIDLDGLEQISVKEINNGPFQPVTYKQVGVQVDFYRNLPTGQRGGMDNYQYPIKNRLVKNPWVEVNNLDERDRQLNELHRQQQIDREFERMRANHANLVWNIWHVSGANDILGIALDIKDKEYGRAAGSASLFLMPDVLEHFFRANKGVILGAVRQLDSYSDIAKFKGKSGVYIHYFESGKVYVGQATDLGERPFKSLETLIDNNPNKLGVAVNDVYKGSVFMEAPQGLSLNALEQGILSRKGGHNTTFTYNQRSAPNFGSMSKEITELMYNLRELKKKK